MGELNSRDVRGKEVLHCYIHFLSQWETQLLIQTTTAVHESFLCRPLQVWHNDHHHQVEWKVRHRFWTLKKSTAQKMPQNPVPKHWIANSFDNHWNVNAQLCCDGHSLPKAAGPCACFFQWQWNFSKTDVETELSPHKINSSRVWCKNSDSEWENSYVAKCHPKMVWGKTWMCCVKGSKPCHAQFSCRELREVVRMTWNTAQDNRESSNISTSPTTLRKKTFLFGEGFFASMVRGG